MWRCCCARLEAAFTLDGTAAPKEVKRRRLFFWVMFVAFMLSLVHTSL